MWPKAICGSGSVQDGDVAWVQEVLTSSLCFHPLGYSIILSHGQEQVSVWVRPFF